MTEEANQAVVGTELGNPESAEVYLEAARHRLDTQVSANVALDNRIAAAFTVGSTVLPLTIGLLNQQFATVDTWVKLLLAAAIAAYVGLLILLQAAYSLRSMRFRPDIPTLQLHSLTYPSGALRQWVADEYARSILINDRMLIDKGERAKWGLRSLYIEGLLLSFAALATIF